MTIVYLLIFTFALTLIDLPYSYYTGYTVEHHFGLSTQTFGGWFADSLKSSYIATLFMVLLIPLAYWDC